MTDALVQALEADTGVTAVVGAGGKKSTLYALADRLERAVVTATVRIPIFDERVADVVCTPDPVATLESRLGRADDGRVEDDDGVGGADGFDGANGFESDPSAWPLGLVPERDRSDRYRGYEPDQIDAIAGVDGVDHVLVKADGARTRLFKAPNEREPQIPSVADTVLAIASCHAVGRPLDAGTVHRPECVAELTGRAVGEPITPTDVATVLTHPDGGLKRVPEGTSFVPVVNMVDDDGDLETARAIGEAIIEDDEASEGRVSTVVLTSMICEEPLVTVLE
ncbi:selenium cofactor biosynthesis protein YqeC [Natronosalvus halobius]|uniref:selenium cofactor biosynthesis protein YqeC n=1 Tax=Natronosalvus halobius TaxID=2953746 RepID=UPI0020A018D0|nr:selenium cofactor biosynthesis protein YqeC [Natronosalvus halobius]USZ72036.1 selenium cofactor biosynthesis protein YqeC [Natronosalvus halobius]